MLKMRAGGALHCRSPNTLGNRPARGARYRTGRAVPADRATRRSSRAGFQGRGGSLLRCCETPISRTTTTSVIKRFRGATASFRTEPATDLPPPVQLLLTALLRLVLPGLASLTPLMARENSI